MSTFMSINGNDTTQNRTYENSEGHHHVNQWYSMADYEVKVSGLS
jgi:hypothetical protein